MTGFGIFLLCYWALNALAAVLMVGKQRPVLTNGGAAFCLIIYGALMLATVHYLHT